MAKVRTTLYISGELLKRAKKKGINLSQLLSQTLESALSGVEPESMEQAQIIALKRKKGEQNKVLSFLLSKLEREQVKAEIIGEKIEKARQMLRMVKYSERVSELIREMNRIIREYEYDFDQIWEETEEIRKELAELEHAVDEEWIKDQIERIRIWLL